MASVEDCEQALQDLAKRLAERHSPGVHDEFDRSLSCTLRDLGVVFTGRLQGGQLIDIRRTDDPRAQIRLNMTGEDLLRLVGGELNLASAWATGRVRVQAGVRDLIRLRTIF